MAILRCLSKSMDGLESVQEVVDWNTNASDNSPSNDNARWNIVDMFRKNNSNNRAASVTSQQKQKKMGRDLVQRKSVPPTTLDKLELHAAAEQQEVVSTNANGGKDKLPRTVAFQRSSCPNIDFGPLAESEQIGLDDSITDCSSVVSEVTMMTYSNEKANMIKDEFFKRIREHGSKFENPVAYVTSLSPTEREAMLREIQEEQEQTFRHVAFDKKKIKKKNTFELQTQNVNVMNSPQAPQFIETRISSNTLPNKKKQSSTDTRFSSFSSIATAKHGNKMTRAESSTATIKRGNHCSNSMRPIPRRNSQLRNNCFDNLTIQEKKPAPILFDLSTLYSASSASKTDSLLSSSLQHTCTSLASKTGEEKVEMSMDPQDQDDDQEEEVEREQVQHEPEFFTREERDEDLIAEGPQIVNIKEPQQQEVASVSTSSSTARISDIIELKLLIANQQATIDTLASKLHNLELANRRLELDASLHSTKSEGLLRQLSTASSSSMNNTSSSSSSSREEEYRNQQLVNENLELRRQLQDMKKFGNVGDSRNDRKFVVQ